MTAQPCEPSFSPVVELAEERDHMDSGLYFLHKKR